VLGWGLSGEVEEGRAGGVLGGKGKGGARQGRGVPRPFSGSGRGEERRLERERELGNAASTTSQY
jgi:hypothetical protein